MFHHTHVAPSMNKFNKHASNVWHRKWNNIYVSVLAVTCLKFYMCVAGCLMCSNQWYIPLHDVNTHSISYMIQIDPDHWSAHSHVRTLLLCVLQFCHFVSYNSTDLRIGILLSIAPSWYVRIPPCRMSDFNELKHSWLQKCCYSALQNIKVVPQYSCPKQSVAHAYT